MFKNTTPSLHSGFQQSLYNTRIKSLNQYAQTPPSFDNNAHILHSWVFRADCQVCINFPAIPSSSTLTFSSVHQEKKHQQVKKTQNNWPAALTQARRAECSAESHSKWGQLLYIIKKTSFHQVYKLFCRFENRSRSRKPIWTCKAQWREVIIMQNCKALTWTASEKTHQH